MDFAEFERTGILRIVGAFPRADAARMCDIVWDELAARHGMDRGDPATWEPLVPSGMTSSKRSKAFAPISGPALETALDALLGAGRWLPPKQFGNVLVTMPGSEPWRVPHRIWHSDFLPTLPRSRLLVVKVWALCDDVGLGGAGTPHLEGSHRAFARYLASTPERDYKKTKLGFLASDPWLRLLTSDRADAERDEALLAGAEVHGVPVRVVETTGRAGDVWITHPWVQHSIAVNASDRPRIMRSFAVPRREPVG